MMPPLMVQAAIPAAVNESSGYAWSLAIGIGGLLIALSITMVRRRQPSRLLLTVLIAALVIGLVGLGW